MSQKGSIPRSRLLDRTLELLRKRGEDLTVKKIAEDTGLHEGWLWMFITNGEYLSPSVCRIVILYEYLTKSQLELK
jgi:hypothetical protein